MCSVTFEPSNCLSDLQDMPIEVDENGTLDLSMKKCKENVKAPTKAPLDESLATSESAAMAKGGSVLISPAFYQPLCERDSWESPVNFSKAHGVHEAEVKRGLYIKKKERQLNVFRFKEPDKNSAF